jgi:uncharacterized protein involved in exopolysaccharide biosynthesis
LTEEANAAEGALRTLERERIEFLRKNGLGLGIEKEKFEIQKLADLEERAADTRSKIASAESSLGELERQIRAEPATRTITTSFEMNMQRETTKMKRLELQTQLVFMRGRYREDSPEVKELLANIAGLDAIVAEASERVPKSSTDALNAARLDLLTRENNVRSDLAGLKGALAAMQQREAQLRSRMALLPTLEATLHGYDRQYKFEQEMYLNLVGKRAQAAVSVAGLRAMPSIRIVAEAVRPDGKTWPKNIILYPLALAGGLILGLAIALAKAVVLDRVRRQHVVLGRGSAPFYGLVSLPTKAPRISVVMPERLAPPSTT